MAAAGVGHWVLKVTDGTTLFNGDALGPSTAYAKSRGVHVWVWGYVRDSRFADPAVQGELLGKRATALGANGVVIDVEREWLKDDPSVVPLMTALRRGYPTGPVYASSYSTLTLHQEFPFDRFTAVCDGWMPQVYQTPQARWAQRSFGEFRALGKGVILTGIGSHEMGSASDTLAFLTACRALDVVCNLWVYEQMNAAMWDTVTTLLQEATGV